jgi:hypothetical protein
MVLLPDTSCLLPTDFEGCLSWFRYALGYVTVNGKPTDGPGHGYDWRRRETWGAKLAQAAAEANLSCTWLVRPADFSLLPLSKPEVWSDWHQIKGRWRSCVVGASRQSSGLAFLFCRVFNTELALSCIVLCVDLRTTTQTYDCEELRFTMLSGLGYCCRQYCDHIVPAFFRYTVQIV